MVGVVYEVQPEPPDPNSTVWFDAGEATIGLEYRHVTPESLAASYADDAGGLAEIEAKMPPGGFTDDGISIHVCDRRDGHEYLRFDCFDSDPHYHYIRSSGDHNNVVMYDAVAGGPMLDWARARLIGNVSEMLVFAGAGELAARLDLDRFARVADEVCDEAVRVEAARRSTSTG